MLNLYFPAFFVVFGLTPSSHRGLGLRSFTLWNISPVGRVGVFVPAGSLFFFLFFVILSTLFHGTELEQATNLHVLDRFLVKK